MASYYVNDDKQPGGEYEVHVPSCHWFPSSRTYLGDYDSCYPAVARANMTHSPANGCAYCCPPCHTG